MSHQVLYPHLPIWFSLRGGKYYSPFDNIWSSMALERLVPSLWWLSSLWEDISHRAETQQALPNLASHKSALQHPRRAQHSKGSYVLSS